MRPDSRLMLSVFRSICAEPDFEDKVRLRSFRSPLSALTRSLQLTNVRDRVDEIESLHRTSELTVKNSPADLGGFLRIRVGRLEKEHEESADDDGDGGRIV